MLRMQTCWCWRFRVPSVERLDVRTPRSEGFFRAFLAPASGIGLGISNFMDRLGKMEFGNVGSTCAHKASGDISDFNDEPLLGWGHFSTFRACQVLSEAPFP